MSSVYLNEDEISGLRDTDRLLLTIYEKKRMHTVHGVCKNILVECSSHIENPDYLEKREGRARRPIGAASIGARPKREDHVKIFMRHICFASERLLRLPHPIPSSLWMVVSAFLRLEFNGVPSLRFVI